MLRTGVLLNAQSCNPSAQSRCAWKLPYLRETIEAIPGIVPFVAVTETWLKPYIEDSQISHGWEKYRVHRCDRRYRTGGGVMLLSHFNLPLEDHVKIDKDSCQLLLCSSTPTKWVLGVLYRSPSAPVADFRACLDEVKRYIDERPDYTVCLMGDFNVPEVSWDPPVANPRTGTSDALMSFTEDSLLSQYIDSPSRGKSYLDLVFSNSERLVSWTTTRDTKLSDHRLVEFGLNRDPCSVSKETVPSSFAADEFRSLDIRRANIKAIGEYLDMVNWKDVLGKCTTDELPRVFRDILFQAAQIFTPRKKPRRGKPNMVRKLARKKRALQQRLTKIMEDEKAPEEQIRALEKRLNELYWQIREAVMNDKCKQEELAIEKIRENSKYFYSYAKRFAGESSRISALREEDGEICTDGRKIAEVLAMQFKAVFSDPVGAESTVGNEIDVPDYVEPRDGDVDFSPGDILEAIKDMKADSAAGPDGIPALLLKQCADSVSYPLYLMWKRSLGEGIVPSSSKESLVTPLFKKGSRSLAANYRPVSLTDHTIKIFERVVRKKLVDHFERNDLFNEIQHGFRRGKSTLTQLLDHFDEVHRNALDGKDTDSLYLDYSKAFDRVDHGILIRKLRRYRVHEGLIKWIQSFLEGRVQRVTVDGCLSGAVLVISGVPQGSVLGPLLFLIFINDIASVVSGSTLRCFADDTRILKGIGGEDDKRILQRDLEAVTSWSLRNNMKLHADKFEYLPHGAKRDPLSHPYTTEAGTLEPSLTVRDLGVLVQADLDWEGHIRTIAESGRRKAAWVLSVFKTRDREAMITLYKSMVRSLLEYCCPLWNPTEIGDIELLEGVQRSFTRRIAECKGMNYWQRLQYLRISSLQRRRERYIILHMWKMIHGHVSNDIGVKDTKGGRLGTRAEIPSMVCLGAAQTKYDKSFAVMGPKLWNCLPAQINQITEFQVFKTQLSRFLDAIPDQPPVTGYSRRSTNSILDIDNGELHRAIPRSDEQ